MVPKTAVFTGNAPFGQHGTTLALRGPGEAPAVRVTNLSADRERDTPWQITGIQDQKPFLTHRSREKG